MKKILILLSCLLILSLCSCHHPARPAFPSFDLLLIDSATQFNTSRIPDGKPIILMYFSPDCEHCQQQTAAILDNMAALKNVRFYFLTIDPFDRLKVYNDHYNISRYPNILLGKDIDFSFYRYYTPKQLPFLAIYNPEKKLRFAYNGGADARTLIQALKELN